MKFDGLWVGLDDLNGLGDLDEVGSRARGGNAFRENEMGRELSKILR